MYVYIMFGLDQSPELRNEREAEAFRAAGLSGWIPDIQTVGSHYFEDRQIGLT